MTPGFVCTRTTSSRSIARPSRGLASSARQRRPDFPCPAIEAPPHIAPWVSTVDEEEYVKKVHSILDEIEIGAVYQVNLTNSL